MDPTPYLPETFPHRWLPAGVDLRDWARIEPWYRQILVRPAHSPEELESWLYDVGELDAAVSQEGARRYIAMTLQTDDPVPEGAYLEWAREVEPRLKAFQAAIREKYLDSPHRAGLPKQRTYVFDRDQENHRALYREVNVPREAELAGLAQQYEKILGGMTVPFRGSEYTPAQMAPFGEDTDRALRRESWEREVDRYLADRDALDALFDRMVGLRMSIAEEAGFDSVADYAHRCWQRFDYGAEDVARFRDVVRRLVVPLANELQERRRRDLGVEALRPWDLAADPLGRPPLRPFTDAGQLAEGVRAIFARIDPELGAQFEYLHRRGLLDLANRKGKAPGAYQLALGDERLPFIFSNAVGVDGDVRNLLHEGGHALHTLAARCATLAAYRQAPLEFCEVAAISMELLGARDTEDFYDPSEADRSYRRLLEDIVLALPWIATVDAFEHWVYAHPGHSHDERRAAWADLLDQFGGTVDWSGCEEARANSWHQLVHIFASPFYFIAYGIAQLGALQVWRRALEDRAVAVAAYRRALALGGSRPLPELLAAAGIRLDFSDEMLRPLMDTIRAELGRLAE